MVSMEASIHLNIGDYVDLGFMPKLTCKTITLIYLIGHFNNTFFLLKELIPRSDTSKFTTL